MIRIFNKVPRSPIVCTTFYDENYQLIGDIAIATLKKFAGKFGYDLLLPSSVQHSRPLAWTKILIIEQLFSLGYKYVFWMDADAMIVDYRTSLNSLLDSNNELFLVKHCDSCQREIPNTGVMLLKNSRWCKQILKRMWKMETYINHQWWENAALIHLFAKDDFSMFGIPSQRKILNNRNNNRLQYIDLAWNSIPIGTGYESPNPIIIHFAGHPMIERQEKMKQLSDYLKNDDDGKD